MSTLVTPNDILAAIGADIVRLLAADPNLDPAFRRVLAADPEIVEVEPAEPPDYSDEAPLVDNAHADRAAADWLAWRTA